MSGGGATAVAAGREFRRTLVGPSGAGLVALTALAVWLVWPSFEPGRIVNLDAPRHLLRSMVMAQQFLPAGHVDGWSPFWYLGAQLFLFQSYGYFFLIGASALALAPIFSLEEVFKFWYALPIVALPSAMAWMARRLGLAPAGAIAAALASLTFSSPMGYGVQGVYGIGLLLQGVGLVAFALAWPLVVEGLLGGRVALWRAGLMVGATLLLHFITGAYLLAAAGGVAALLALSSRTAAPLLRYAVVACLALLLAAHTLMPSLEWHDLAGSGVGWGANRGLFGRFLAGTLFDAPPLAWGALAAAAWTLWRGPTALRLTSAVLFSTAILAASSRQGWEPALVGGILDVLVRPRALPYVALLQALFVGVGLDALFGLAQRVGRRRGLVFGRIMMGVAVALLVWIALPEIALQRRFVVTESSLKKADHQVYERMVTWLRGHVRPPAIVAIPRGLFPSGVIGARSVISLFNMDTGLFTLGGDQAELSHSVRRAGQVNLERLDEKPERDAKALRDAGVSYVVLGSAGVRKRLRGNRDFRRVFEYEAPVGSEPAVRRDGHLKKPLGFAVYRLRGGGQWLRATGVRALGMTHTPERIAWSLERGRAKAPRPAVAAINWHPNWKAYANGAPVPTMSSPSGRVSLRLPADAERLTLVFERSAREKLWNWLSLVTLLFVLVSWRGAVIKARALGL